jgi:hypothetical protein
MQSAIKSVDPNAPTKKTVLNTLNYIYKTNGLKGLYRGVAPRIGLGEYSLVQSRARLISRCLANYLYGQLCRLCQGCVSYFSLRPVVSY